MDRQFSNLTPLLQKEEEEKRKEERERKKGERKCVWGYMLWGERESSIPVFIHVEELGADKESHVVDADADQDFVPRPIERFVLVAVDLEIHSVVSMD